MTATRSITALEIIAQETEKFVAYQEIERPDSLRIETDYISTCLFRKLDKAGFHIIVFSNPYGISKYELDIRIKDLQII